MAPPPTSNLARTVLYEVTRSVRAKGRREEFIVFFCLGALAKLRHDEFVMDDDAVARRRSPFSRGLAIGRACVGEHDRDFHGTLHAAGCISR